MAETRVTRVITPRLTAELHDRLKRCAADEGRSLNQYVVDVLDRASRHQHTDSTGRPLAELAPHGRPYL
jgi:uncharacterized protein (DUF1778 family)